MELGLGIAAGPDADVLAPLAAEAEALGYVSIWCNDSPAGEGLLQLRRWAEVSRAIDLCVGVISLDRHQPNEIAARVAELDLPRQRLVVGIGAGFDSHPLAAVRSGVEALREGLPDVRLAVAAMGPKMCGLAGEVGDATLLNWMTPERATWARPLVAEGARASGREPGTIYGYVRVAAGEGAAERLAREAGFYTQMPHYARHFEGMGGDPLSVGVAAEDPATLAAALAAYSALDLPVARVLSERTPAAILEVARAAIGD